MEMFYYHKTYFENTKKLGKTLTNIVNKHFRSDHNRNMRNALRTLYIYNFNNNMLS